MTRKLGAAVVGLGVGEQHARAYLNDPRCELVSLFDLDREKAMEIASRLGTGSVARSFEDILQDPRVQVISIASYDDAHSCQVAAAIDAGKNVFAEKPLCRTIAELAEIKKLWSRYGGSVKLTSNLVLRAAPVYQWLKREIASGGFGTPYAVDGDYLYGRLDKITHGWRKDVENYSVIEGGGVHLLDLLVWLTGQRPETVFAVGNRICTDNTSFRYNDYVASTLQFPSGLIARISANFGCVHRHQHVLRVFGTGRTFVLDDAGPRIHVTRDPVEQAISLDLGTLPASKGELIGPFVSAILEDQDLNAHTQQMFDVISICAACDTSVRSGAVTEVEYV